MRHGIACALILVLVVGCCKRVPIEEVPDVPEPVLAPHPDSPLRPTENQPPLSEAQKLVRRLTEGDILERQDAAFALAALGKDAEEAVPALVAALDSISLREPATRALLAVGPRGWHALLSSSATQHHFDRVRQAARVQRAAEGKYASLRTLGAALSDRCEAVVPLPRFEEYKSNLVFYGAGINRPLTPPSPLTLPFLIRALRNPDPYARMLAAERLEQLGSLARPAIASLIAVLEDPWPLQEQPRLGGYSAYVATYSVRIAAVNALLAIGPPGEEALAQTGLPRLLAGLQTDNLYIRQHTAQALGLLGPRALPAALCLVEDLRQTIVSGSNRDFAPFTEALRAIGPEMLPALVSLLDDANELVRGHALWLIGEQGARARAHAGRVRAILRNSEKTRSVAAGTLVRIAPDDPATLETLVEVLKPCWSWDVFEALCRLGPRARAAVPALVPLLGPHEYEVLQRIGLSRAEVAEKLRAAYHNQPTPEWVVIYAQDETAGRYLLKKLAVPREPWRRLPNAVELCRIGPEFAKHAVPVFIELLKDHPEDQAWYERSIHALRDAGPAAAVAVPVLVQHLDGPFQQAIVETLCHLGPIARDAIPAVRLRVRHEKTLPWAAPLLARLAPTDPEVLPALLALLAYPDYTDRERAAEELGRLGPAARQAVSRLERALSDENARVRMFATAALLRITGDQDRFVQPLRRAVRDTPSAARAIARLGADWSWSVEALRDALCRPTKQITSDEFGFTHHGTFFLSTLGQQAAALGLAELGPVARSAVPDLIGILHEESRRLPLRCDDCLVLACARALGAIGPEARSALPILDEFVLRGDVVTSGSAREASARIRAGESPK
jgi:HEAT repeat protein